MSAGAATASAGRAAGGPTAGGAGACNSPRVPDGRREGPAAVWVEAAGAAASLGGRAADGSASTAAIGAAADPAVPGRSASRLCANTETGDPEPFPPSPRANTETGDRSSLRLVGAGTATGDPVPVATIGAEGSALSSDLESEGPAATATPGCA